MARTHAIRSFARDKIGHLFAIKSEDSTGRGGRLKAARVIKRREMTRPVPAARRMKVASHRD